VVFRQSQIKHLFDVASHGTQEYADVKFTYLRGKLITPETLITADSYKQRQAVGG
jgi:hypothetical protein